MVHVVLPTTVNKREKLKFDLKQNVQAHLRVYKWNQLGMLWMLVSIGYVYSLVTCQVLSVPATTLFLTLHSAAVLVVR